MIFFQHGIDPHTPLRDWYFGTSFREKYDECLRKTAEVHGEMMKGLGYRLKRIHKRRPTVSSGVYSVHLGVAHGGIFWGKKSFISYFLSFRTEDLSRHVFIDSFIEDKVQKLNFMKWRLPSCRGALAWDISKIGVCGNNNILMGPLLSQQGTQCSSAAVLTAQFSCDCYRQGKGWSLVLLMRVGREYMWGPSFGGAGKRKNCSRTSLRVKRISA